MSTKLEITLSLAINLIIEQFPQWSHLSVKPVELSHGHELVDGLYGKP